MDYGKLIRRLRNDADAYRDGKTLGRAFADQEDVLDNAAAAIEALQAENSALRKMQPVELSGESARAFELALKVSELQSDLARVTAERDAAVKDLNEILSMDEFCPIQCEWCKWDSADCDGKTPEWRGIKED